MKYHPISQQAEPFSLKHALWSSRTAGFCSKALAPTGLGSGRDDLLFRQAPKACKTHLLLPAEKHDFGQIAMRTIENNSAPATAQFTAPNENRFIDIRASTPIGLLALENPGARNQRSAPPPITPTSTLAATFGNLTNTGVAMAAIRIKASVGLEMPRRRNAHAAPAHDRIAARHSQVAARMRNRISHAQCGFARQLFVKCVDTGTVSSLRR